MDLSGDTMERGAMNRQPLSVLLVEDSDADAELIGYSLRVGYDVQMERVQDAEGMRTVLSRGVCEVIISDYQLPQFDAPAALDILRQSGLDIPFIVVSGTIGEDVAVKMMRSGAHDYLLKSNLTRLNPAVAREIAEAGARRARRQLAAALHETEERLSLAIDATQLGTFDFYPLTGRLIWSTLTKGHFGLPADAEISWDVFLRGLHGDDRERVAALVRDVLRPESGGHFTTEYRTLGIRDGIERWLSAEGRASYGPDGLAVRFIGVVQDVSERKRMEMALRESVERETEANRTKDQFLANLSHELRTPLNVILGYSRMVASAQIELTGPQANGVHRMIGIVERNAVAQLRIVEDLLDVQRIVAGRFDIAHTRSDLQELGQTVVDSLEPTATAKRLRMDVRLEPIVMMCDGPRIQQVIWNLLSNAIKFTPEGGQVALRLIRCGSQVIIGVEDTGEGIPTQFLPHVFDRFQQLDMSTTRRHSGMGLGLSIVKQVVELHGGTILAQSNGPGLGASFTVTLAYARDVKPTRPKDSEHRPGTSKKRSPKPPRN
jgi:PAS domain S-box-containing protein